jgi:hypothetical protein
MSTSNQSLLNQLLSKDLTYTYHCSPFIKRLFEADKALEQFSLQHISHPFSRQEMESWLDSRRISDEIKNPKGPPKLHSLRYEGYEPKGPNQKDGAFDEP